MSSSAEVRRGCIGKTTEDVRKLREIIDAQIDATKYGNYQMLQSATSEDLEKLLEETRGGIEQLGYLEKVLMDYKEGKTE